MPSPPDNNEHHEDDDREIQRQNLMAFAFVAVLTLLAIILVDGFRQQVRMQECLEARHRDCIPLDIEPSGK